MEAGIIRQVSIVDHMQTHYLDYSMSVIVSRALPDVRDGLKPVHRRVLYAMERMGLQNNRSMRKCAGVVGEVSKLSLNASRRLQLCAGESGVTALIIRRWSNTAEKSGAGEPNAASTRWRIAPHPSPPVSGFDGLARQWWQLDLLRVRGGEPHSWVLEACDATGHLALPAALADRSAAASEQRRAATG